MAKSGRTTPVVKSPVVYSRPSDAVIAALVKATGETCSKTNNSLTLRHF